MVGLNFADEGEAEKFYETVNMKLQEKKRRNSECKGREAHRKTLGRGVEIGRERAGGMWQWDREIRRGRVIFVSVCSSVVAGCVVASDEELPVSHRLWR